MNLSPNQTKEKQMKKEVKKITHTGELQIGDMRVACYVTEDGTRLLNSAQVASLVGITTYEKALKSGGQLLRFFERESLRPFVSAISTTALKSLKNGQNEGANSSKTALTNTSTTALLSEEILQPIKALLPTKDGRYIQGYRSGILGTIVRVMRKAERAGVLKSERQKIVAEQAELLGDALIGVGEEALIDEATGYQSSREKDHLHRLFNHYLAPECRPWVKTFPDEFFQQVIRLTGCKYDPKTNQLKPLSVAKFIRDFIYGSFPMGVLDEIDKRNPVIGKTPNGSYKRRAKHHQWMSETLGKNELMARIRLATAIMKGHQDIESFKRHWAQIIAPEQLVLVQQSFAQK